MKYFGIIAFAAALASADFTLSGGEINGSNQNGVATYNGYVCTGAIYVGCDEDINNAFCCVGARAQQNICNGGQATTCSEGTYTPLTAAANAAATSTADSSSTGASSSRPTTGASAASGASPSGTTSGASSTSSGAAATANALSGQLGAAGMVAVVVKVLFL